MFGYTLKLMKKDDLRELEVFENSVITLKNLCGDMIRFYSRRFELNFENTHNIAFEIDKLASYIDIYFHNKFSSPGNSLIMLESMDRVKELGTNMLKLIDLHVRTMSFIENIENSEEAYDDSSDDADKIKELNNHMINEAIPLLCDAMIARLRQIQVCITHDVVKISNGVDIIKEYKNRQKQFKHDKNLWSNIIVSYNAISKSDNEFLQKLKIQKENDKNVK